MQNTEDGFENGSIAIVFLFNKGDIVYTNELLPTPVLESFNFDETKKNINEYFAFLKKLEWEWAKLHAQKGLTANYDFSVQSQKQSYSPVHKDEFDLMAKDYKEEQLKNYLSSYHLAKSILSDRERLYIEEYFVKRKYDEELIDILGFNYVYSRGYIKLKKSAIYKMADFLNLVVEKKEGEL